MTGAELFHVKRCSPQPTGLHPFPERPQDFRLPSILTVAERFT